MCLVVFAWRAHPRYPFIVAANRDELHARPAEAMHWWPDEPGILAGRDLQAGGTWLAVGRDGRFATVTNFRERFRSARGKESRGRLVRDFVASNDAPLDFAASLDADRYAGFCLLAADRDGLGYTSNRDDATRLLEPGIYGLSNSTLDTPWPKLVRCRDGLAKLLESDEPGPTALLSLLADTTPAPVRDLDDSLPLDLARAVSAPFIKTDRYGTRCTTVVMLDADGHALVTERRFDPDGRARGDSQYRFRVET